MLAEMGEADRDDGGGGVSRPHGDGVCGLLGLGGRAGPPMGGQLFGDAAGVWLGWAEPLCGAGWALLWVGACSEAGACSAAGCSAAGCAAVDSCGCAAVRGLRRAFLGQSGGGESEGRSGENDGRADTHGNLLRLGRGCTDLPAGGGPKRRRRGIARPCSPARELGGMEAAWRMASDRRHRRATNVTLRSCTSTGSGQISARMRFSSARSPWL